MKIDNPVTGVRDVRPTARRGEKGKTRSPSRDMTDHDQVDLSQASASLGALEAQLASVETMDAEKIEAVRQAIAEGRFNVNEDAVAEALVRETLEMLRRSGR